MQDLQQELQRMRYHPEHGEHKTLRGRFCPLLTISPLLLFLFKFHQYAILTVKNMKRILIMILIVDLMMASILISLAIQNVISRENVINDIHEIQKDINRLDSVHNNTIIEQHIEILHDLDKVLNKSSLS